MMKVTVFIVEVITIVTSTIYDDVIIVIKINIIITAIGVMLLSPA